MTTGINGGTVLCFDTETTGLPKDWKRPHTDVNNWPQVVQLGMAFQNVGGDVQTFKCLIKPPNGVAFPIPAAVSEIHKVTDEMCVEQGVPLSEALDAFEFWLNGADVLIAHNMSFDRTVIKCEAHRLQRQLMVKRGTRIVCTKEATTDYLKLPGNYGYKWPTLDELHRHLFGDGFDGAHDALTDVLATLKCYNELTNRGTFTSGGIFLPTQQ